MTTILTSRVTIFDGSTLSLWETDPNVRVEGRTYTFEDRSAKQVATDVARNLKVPAGHLIEVTTDLHGDDYGVEATTVDLFEVDRARRVMRPYGPYNPTGSYLLPEEVWVRPL